MPCNITKYLFPCEYLRFTLVVFTYLIISLTAAIAQDIKESGSLPVYNFSSKTYNAHEQNWCISQDKRGIMYFGNNSGVLEYDGVNWRLIPTAKQTKVSALGIDSLGWIYVGALGEVGYLAPDDRGNLRFIGLTEKLPDYEQKFQEIISCLPS